MAFDYSKAVAAAVAGGEDQTKVVKGGTYTPPAAGVARLRFIAYVELGKHENNVPGKPPKVEDQVQLVFELSGPKHAPKVLDDGTVIPFRISLYLNKSQNEKAHFFKLFKRMNYSGTAQHLAQLLGQSFLGTVVHVAGKDGKVRAFLKDDAGYTIRSPHVEDPETGESRLVEAAPPVSEIRAFLWDYADAEMWASLYIDGFFDEEKTQSRNVFQNKIKSALNWDGSPMWNILRSNGAVPDVPGGEGKPDPLAAAASVPPPAPAPAATAAPAASSPSSGAAADPLAGMA